MTVDIAKAHAVMNQFVQQTKFCEEEDGHWNTRLLYALDSFQLVGDILRRTEEDLYRTTNLGRNTMARLKAFLASHGLSLGMTGPVMDTWVPRTRS